MTGTTFYKMTGSGNDFIMLDGRVSSLDTWTPERIVDICARRTGAGADGLVVLEPGPEPGSVRFHFFNNDGGRTDMCGNASLCATRLAAHLDLGDPEGLILHTDAGAFATRCVPGPGERAEITLGPVPALVPVAIAPGPGESRLQLGTVGVPHLVVVVDDVDAPDADPGVRGRTLRHHPGLGAGGANVNFISAASTGGWRMRTFERGVEAETLACGTGAVACATALVEAGLDRFPVDVLTRSGRTLTISIGEGKADSTPRARLAGEGRLVYIGTLP